MATEKIVYDGKTLAMIIDAKKAAKGITFYTPDDNTLQIGTLIHPKGKIIRAHIHCPVKIERTASLQEVLYIEEGKVKVIFYTDVGKRIKSKILRKGDMILLMEGGHGFEILEPTRMLEVKQGPYIPESRKDLNIGDQ